MERTSSQKAVRVLSIIMIVFAALILVFGILGMTLGGAAGIMSATASDQTGALAGSMAIMASVFVVIVGIVYIIIGIFGLRGSNDASKIMPFFVMSIIGLVVSILNLISTLVIGPIEVRTITSGLIGLIMPAMCIYFAYRVKQEAGY